MFRYLQFQSSRQNSLSGCCLKRYVHEGFSAVTQSHLLHYLLLPHPPAFAVSLSSLFYLNCWTRTCHTKDGPHTQIFIRSFAFWQFFSTTKEGCELIFNRNILKSNSSYKALVIPRDFMFLSAALERVERVEKQYWIISVTRHSLLLLFIIAVQVQSICSCSRATQACLRKICLW